MRIEEAIFYLKNTPVIASNADKETVQKAYDMAIEALEKQIPKKFKMVDNCTPVCPVCGEAVWDMEWCNSCGQRLDDDEEEK